MTDFTIEHHPTRGSNWSVGDALFWRDEDGVHAMVMLTEVERGPRGGFRAPGTMSHIRGPSLASVNRGLKALGFHSSRLRASDITTFNGARK